MKSTVLWEVNVTETDKVPTVIWSVCYSPDGSKILSGGVSRVYVYEASTGSLRTTRSLRYTITVYV